MSPTWSGNDASVSSWGWCDDDGRTCMRDVATHRLWHVTHQGQHVGFIALPVDAESADVLIAGARFADAVAG